MPRNKKEKGNIFYVYIYLDDRKPGRWEYNGLIFHFQPFYVGKGNGRRMLNHLEAASLRRISLKNRIINKIINVTGEKPTFYKIYENLSENEAFDIEIDMIKHFGRIDLKSGILANATHGGPGTGKREKGEIPIGKSTIIQPSSKRVDQYDLDGNFIQKFDSISLAAKSLISSLLRSPFQRLMRGIKRCCEGRKAQSDGFVWKFDGTSPYVPKEEINLLIKQVFQYSIDGDYLNKFKSYTEAAETVEGDPCAIGSCVLGKIRTIYGFRWKSYYSEEKLDPLPKINNGQKPINAFNELGVVIKSYASIMDAQKDFGNINIRRVLIKTWQKAGGVFWRRGEWEEPKEKIREPYPKGRKRIPKT